MEEAKANKNIYIWILSSISFLMSAFAYVFFVYWLIPESLYYSRSPKSWFNVMFLYFLVALVLGIIGLIVGIKQRKVGTRKSAILGIIIPLFAIIVSLIAGFAVELSFILSST